MLSYSYQPKSAISHNSALQQPSKGVQQQQQLLQRLGSVDEDTFDVVQDDVVTLDCLVGVVFTSGDYYFVQYKPGERHKRCAGMKISPVHQLNMFLTTLLEQAVSVEMALCTLLPYRKTLWLRVSLANLTELSLEPLWMIKGRAQLHATQRCVTITIDDRSLERCTLDSDSFLLSKSDADHKKKMSLIESELNNSLGEKSRGCSSGHPQKRTMLEHEDNSHRDKKPKLACDQSGPNVQRHSTRSSAQSDFNKKQQTRGCKRPKVYYNKTRPRALGVRVNTDSTANKHRCSNSPVDPLISKQVVNQCLKSSVSPATPNPAVHQGDARDAEVREQRLMESSHRHVLHELEPTHHGLHESASQSADQNPPQSSTRCASQPAHPKSLSGCRDPAEQHQIDTALSNGHPLKKDESKGCVVM